MPRSLHPHRHAHRHAHRQPHASAAARAPGPERAAGIERTEPNPPPATIPSGKRWRGDAGQATTEYALILLGAALVALLVVAWATSGGASGRIGQLFDAVVDSVISRLGDPGAITARPSWNSRSAWP